MADKKVNRSVPSPGALTAFLSILALIFAGGGGVLCCLELYDVGHVDGLTADEAVHGGKIFLAGVAVGCVFWALAYLVRMAYSTAGAVRAGASRRPQGPSAEPQSAMGQLLESVDAPQSAQPTPPPGGFETEPVFDFDLAGSAETAPPDDSDDPRRRKREELTAELAGQVSATIESGELDEAEALLNHLAGQVGQDDAHVTDLRRRLQRQRDELEFGSSEAVPPPAATIEEEVETQPETAAALELPETTVSEEGGTDASDAQKPEPPEMLDAEALEARMQRVSDLMAVAKFEQAEGEARMLAEMRPDDGQVQQLLQRVLRETEAYHADMRHRLKKQVQAHCDNRRWTDALDVAKRLVDTYPESTEGRRMARQLRTLQANARIEEVRGLRDQIRDRLQRRRYAGAVRLAEEIMDRFPDTQAAAELRKQIGRLRQMARDAAAE